MQRSPLTFTHVEFLPANFAKWSTHAPAPQTVVVSAPTTHRPHRKYVFFMINFQALDVGSKTKATLSGSCAHALKLGSSLFSTPPPLDRLLIAFINRSPSRRSPSRRSLIMVGIPCQSEEEVRSHCQDPHKVKVNESCPPDRPHIGLRRTSSRSVTCSDM